ncbi:MAG TPA: tRNA threonylcarbamoyladenosine dehydratase [Clostridia bacterium]|nr:tRNA threonylcarbamoyladenosine dehydratase [Clostridia bacterium]
MWLKRTELLIGKENLLKLKNSHIVVFGCGGVGSYAIEGLVRAGIGEITIVDKDIIDITNINRQLMADISVVGLSKVEVEYNRLIKINPSLKMNIYNEFVDKNNISTFINKNVNYIIDAIDTISSKLDLVEYANKNNIPIISCMGTGNKLDPSKFEVTDISKTSVCPLAKIMRKELRFRGIQHLKVVYSKELPNKFYNEEEFSKTTASISFVPSVAGLIISGEVIKSIIK